MNAARGPAQNTDTMAPAGYEPLKNEPELEGLLEPATTPLRTSRTSRSRRLVFSAVVLLGVVGCAAFYAFPSRSAHYATEQYSGSLGGSDDTLHHCPSGLPPAAKPPASTNPFASLTVPETVAIDEWVSSPARNLNLTIGDKAGISDNFIYRIEAYRPPKKDTVKYLDNPDTTSPPERFAHVVIHHGAASDPYVQDYLVGPIPVSEKTTMRKLTEIYHRDPIPYNARGFMTGGELSPLLVKVMPILAEATEVRLTPVTR